MGWCGRACFCCFPLNGQPSETSVPSANMERMWVVWVVGVLGRGALGMQHQEDATDVLMCAD